MVTGFAGGVRGSHVFCHVVFRGKRPLRRVLPQHPDIPIVSGGRAKCRSLPDIENHIRDGFVGGCSNNTRDPAGSLLSETLEQNHKAMNKKPPRGFVHGKRLLFFPQLLYIYQSTIREEQMRFVLIAVAILHALALAYAYQQWWRHRKLDIKRVRVRSLAAIVAFITLYGLVPDWVLLSVMLMALLMVANECYFIRKAITSDAEADQLISQQEQNRSPDSG